MTSLLCPSPSPYKEAEAPLGIYSKFSHQDESATAGYYQVLLKDYGINVELTCNRKSDAVFSVTLFLKPKPLSSST